MELHSKRYPGLFALVDDDDYELVSRYSWYPAKRRSSHTFYAQNVSRVDGRRVTLLMHRLIVDYPMVDHENRNGLDNQRHNLREANGSQNAGNRPKQRGVCTSRFKGASWNKTAGKWQARIMIDGKVKSLGYYSDDLEAATAYDAAAIEYFGPYAGTNFPVTPNVVTLTVQLELPLAA